MNVELNSLAQATLEEKTISHTALIRQWFSNHYELIFALVSGLFIFIGWFLEHNHFEVFQLCFMSLLFVLAVSVIIDLFLR